MDNREFASAKMTLQLNLSQTQFNFNKCDDCPEILNGLVAQIFAAATVTAGDATFDLADWLAQSENHVMTLTGLSKTFFRQVGSVPTIDCDEFMISSPCESTNQFDPVLKIEDTGLDIESQVTLMFRAPPRSAPTISEVQNFELCSQQSTSPDNTGRPTATNGCGEEITVDFSDQQITTDACLSITRTWTASDPDCPDMLTATRRQLITVVLGPPSGPDLSNVCDLDANDPLAFDHQEELDRTFFDNNWVAGCDGAVIIAKVSNREICQRCCRNEKMFRRRWLIVDECFDQVDDEEKCNHITEQIQYLRSVNPQWQQYFPSQCECPCVLTPEQEQAQKALDRAEDVGQPWANCFAL